MWHEARRQERKIRGMLVDYRKRAERRRDFYEKIKADPTQFLQVHGRQCKIHLDPQVAAAADSAVMMPWQGNSDTLIDRFDGRAHLDYIPPVKKDEETEVSQEERQLNYERYRIIAQNAFLGITEEKFLKQLQLEEQFGYTELHQKGKKEQKTGGAAIGFNYDEGTAIAQIPEQPDSDHNTAGDSDSDADCSDLDVDLSVNVSKMDAAQAHEMNKHGRQFGMHSNDFYSFLTDDMEEAENRRMAREEEQEKALYAGRKSRRERRYHREKRLANRVLSPPSYAARESPTIATSLRESKSASRSPSPENAGKITFITSFGGEEETPSSSKLTNATYADKVKQSAGKARSGSVERTVYRRRSRSNSRRRKSRSGSRIRSRRSRSRSLSRGKRARRSRSPLRRRSRTVSSRSRSRSASIVKRKSRSRSYSRDRKLHSKPSFRGVSNTNRVYKRQRRGSSNSSSSSSSSSSSRSPLKSKSYSTSPTKEIPNKSRQSQDQEDTKMEVEEPPKVLPRYYGRKRSDESSSDDEEENDAENHNNGEQQKSQSVKSDSSMTGHGNSSGIGTKKSATNVTIIERLKRKRQALLNRQFKADKIAEQLKTEREKQEQQTREDELRMMAIKLRRKQRERRHANDSRSNSSSDSDEGSHRSKSSDSSSKKRPSPPPREKDRDRSAERENRSARHRTDYRGRSRSRERSRERDRRNRRDSRDRRGSRDRDRRDSRDLNSGKDKRSISPRRSYRDRGREDKERVLPKKSLVDY